MNNEKPIAVVTGVQPLRTALITKPLLPRMKARGATSILPCDRYFRTASPVSMSFSASCNGRK